jgi:tetratricopeptide (TPR) repeat protein
LADVQVAAMRGRRDEVDLIARRMFGAVYQGRMNEAAELAVEVQARAVAQSRGPQAGEALISLAISEAIVGRTERAAARVAAAEEDGLVGDQSIDERLVVAALLEDAKGAAAALPAALAASAKNAGGDQARSAVFARLLNALPLMAGGKPAEAVAAAEPVTYSARDVNVISVVSLAKLRAGDLAGAAKGFTFLISVPTNQPTAGPAFAHATLARIQAQLGNKNEARKLYLKFFEMWKDADPDVPLLVQARAEFAKL